jgi:predicted kinase
MMADSERRMAILRGIPGSGKSTYQWAMFPRALVASADHFFTTPEGDYRFDPTRLSEAHRTCFRATVGAVQRGEPLIVVDNTSIRALDIAPYVVLGEAYRYSVKVVTLWVDPMVAITRNIHRVPTEIIVKMAERMEREHLPSWWDCEEIGINRSNHDH